MPTKMACFITLGSKNYNNPMSSGQDMWQLPLLTFGSLYHSVVTMVAVGNWLSKI